LQIQLSRRHKKLRDRRNSSSLGKNPAASSLAELLDALEFVENDDRALDEWNDEVAKKANKLVKWQQVGRALSACLE
jgi:hypothetical protein